ncbi:MAG: Fimbrial protein, partial [Pedosphaera sp.]|nr:Fimbrial protein [Pedosphaera sp.]
VFTLDTSEDKRCRDALYGSNISRTQAGTSPGLNGLSDNGNGFFEFAGEVMIWSRGPDGKYDDSPTAKANVGFNADNILSWQ